MILGISGKIGSGKDTLGKIIQYLDLQKNYPKTWTQWDFDFFINGDHTWKSDYQIKKFGGKLKQIASLVLGVSTEQFESQDFKKTNLGKEWRITNTIGEEKPMTVREFLQKLGTDAARDNIHPDFWVNALFADYIPYSTRGSEYEEIESNWIITDVRFPNEVKAIKDKGGKVIRIERMFNGVPSTHFSETALDNYDGFDAVIENNGTIEELIEKVKNYEDIYIN